MTIKKVEFTYKKKNLKRDGDKWIGYQCDVRDGSKRRRDTFATKREAEDFVDALKNKQRYARAGAVAPSNKIIRISDLFSARLASVTGKQKIFESRVFEYFENLIGSVAVTALGTSHLRTFVSARSKDLTVRNEPVKPQTVDRELTAIAAALHNAGEYFDELANYIAPKIPHPKFRKARRDRIITEDERTRLLTDLWQHSPEIACIFEFAYLTGMRHSEIAKVRLTDLDRANRSLKVYRSKTDATSYISPLTDRMLELLESDREFIFTPYGRTSNKFYVLLRKACERVGVSYGRYREGGIILHDNRHTFVTIQQQNGTDLATIQSFTGHSDKELVLRYSHARPDSRRRAMDVMDGTKRTQKLRQIYDNVAAGKLDFESFVEALDQS